MRKPSKKDKEKTCIKCGDKFINKFRQKYCSDVCRSAYLAYQYCLRNNKFEKPGVGSGGNQELDKNHQWTGESGTSGCRRAMKKLPNFCKICNTTEDLVAHHIDEDRTNNDLSNFEILCRKHHQIHHTANRRDPITGKYIENPTLV